MEESLTCVVCQELYREPVTLQCGHSFCKTCLDSIVQTASTQRREPLCPMCRSSTVSKPFQVNVILRDIVSQYQQQLIREEDEKQGKELCGVHHGKIADMYCTSCATGVCPLCLCEGTGQHVGHTVTTVEEFCSRLKNEITCMGHQGEKLTETMQGLVSEIVKCKQKTEECHNEHANKIRADCQTVVDKLYKSRDDVLKSMAKEANKIPPPGEFQHHEQGIRQLYESTQSSGVPAATLRKIATDTKTLQELKTRLGDYNTKVADMKTQLSLAQQMKINLEDTFKTRVSSFSSAVGNLLGAFEQEVGDISDYNQTIRGRGGGRSCGGRRGVYYSGNANQRGRKKVKPTATSHHKPSASRDRYVSSSDVWFNHGTNRPIGDAGPTLHGRLNSQRDEDSFSAGPTLHSRLNSQREEDSFIAGPPLHSRLNSQREEDSFSAGPTLHRRLSSQRGGKQSQCWTTTEEPWDVEQSERRRQIESWNGAVENVAQSVGGIQIEDWDGTYEHFAQSEGGRQIGWDDAVEDVAQSVGGIQLEDWDGTYEHFAQSEGGRQIGWDDAVEDVDEDSLW